MKRRGLESRPGGGGRMRRPKGAPGLRGRSPLFGGAFLGVFLTTVALASAGETPGGPNWADFFWRTVNFLVLAGLLYRLVAKKAKVFFASRREAIAQDLARAASLRQEARGAFEEQATRLARAEKEIDEIAGMIDAQAKAERERLLADARRAAAKMKEDARMRMEQEYRAAVGRLRKEAALMATRMAEGLLKSHLRPEDHETMIRETVERVAEAARNG